MKNAFIVLSGVLAIGCLQAAPVQVSLGVRAGLANVDAGTVTGAGYLPLSADAATSIKSGTKTFAELTGAVHFAPWFSLEVGYAQLPKFSSQWMQVNTNGSQTLLPVPDARLTYKITRFRISPVFRVPVTPNLYLLGFAGLTEARVRVSTLFMTPGATPQYSEGNTYQSTKASYHVGAGFAYELGGHAALDFRIAYYDLGHHTTVAPWQPPGSNHATAITETVGWSWKF